MGSPDRPPCSLPLCALQVNPPPSTLAPAAPPDVSGAVPQPHSVPLPFGSLLRGDKNRGEQPQSPKFHKLSAFPVCLTSLRSCLCYQQLEMGVFARNLLELQVFKVCTGSVVGILWGTLLGQRLVPQTLQVVLHGGGEVSLPLRVPGWCQNYPDPGDGTRAALSHPSAERPRAFTAAAEGQPRARRPWPAQGQPGGGGERWRWGKAVCQVDGRRPRVARAQGFPAALNPPMCPSLGTDGHVAPHPRPHGPGL